MAVQIVTEGVSHRGPKWVAWDLHGLETRASRLGFPLGSQSDAYGIQQGSQGPQGSPLRLGPWGPPFWSGFSPHYLWEEQTTMRHIETTDHGMWNIDRQYQSHL